MIDYDLIVKELSKGLVPLAMPFVLNLGMERFKQLMEFRTIKYGCGRHSGMTEFIGKYSNTHDKLTDGNILYLHLNSKAVDFFNRKYVTEDLSPYCDTMTVRQFMSIEHNKKISICLY